IGHARSAIVFDVIRRYLSHRGYAVTYVRNFTDIDDKIIARAREKGVDWKSLAGNYIDEYYADMDRLGVRRADIEPKATDFIREIQAMIGDLVGKGYAYPLPDGVYYRVRRFPGYGKLSKRDPEAMMAGARVEVDEQKEDPLDFALWKSSSPDEPSWESPWGGGRPGWHIECSAMSQKLLGETFDIHGGGMDLIFPHHENEIAQSEARTGKPFARYWIHNGFVNVNQEKMSKSLGNFFTIREIFEKCRGWFRGSKNPDVVTAEVLRYFLLSTHYRSPVDFSDAALTEAHAALSNFYNLFQKLEDVAKGVAARPMRCMGTPSLRGSSEEEKIQSALSDFVGRFEAAMNDDFNTADAIAECQKLRATINSLNPETFSPKTALSIQKIFSRFGDILGLFDVTP
ncbi:MAG: cysteine--tRNA ligase, partial [Nitrospirae bacterium]|nr:cysteine--tRNA ligase [Nitrospirota bacterium]